VPGFPDVEKVLVGWFPGVVGVPAMTVLPANFTPPVIRLHRTSGTDTAKRLDRPIVDVDCFGATYADATGKAADVRAAIIFTLPNTTTGGALVTATSTVVGPRWLSYTNPDVVRFQASYELFLHTA
jgi:hypothetical protein